MNIELRKWSIEDKEALIKMCNSIDRSFLSDRLPNPYTNESAEWWLNTIKGNEGKKGVFREIIVDGEIVGTISIDKKTMCIERILKLVIIYCRKYIQKAL